MASNLTPNNLKDRLDNATPEVLPDMLRSIKIGTVLRRMPTTRRKFSFDGAASSPYQLATLDTMELPDDAKAHSIFRATARATAAAGTLGELTPKLYGVTPGDGEIAVAPNGDIVTLAASRYSDVDVTYLPEPCDVVELTLAATTASVFDIPAKYKNRGLVLLMEAEALAGSVIGKKIVLVPGAAPATTKANLNVAKTQVLMNVATDAVTSARIKLGVAPEVDLDALLRAASTFL